MEAISGWFWFRRHSYEAQLPSRIVRMRVSRYNSPSLYLLSIGLSSSRRVFDGDIFCGLVG